MADARGEPTMEDILASIRRIIADDPLTATRVAGVTRSRDVVEDEVSVDNEALDAQLDAEQPDYFADYAAEITAKLGKAEAIDPLPEAATTERDISHNLTDAVDAHEGGRAAIDNAPESDAGRASVKATAELSEDEVLELTEYADTPEEDTIVSDSVASAAVESLQLLNQMVVRPDAGSMTLEGLVRDMLRPMLKEWLDSHLPAIVEQVVAREIARLTAKGR